MQRRAPLTALLGASLIALAGCAAPSDEPAPPLSVDPTLVAQREEASIADCPVTPADTTPVAGGLPDLLLGCLGSDRQVNLAALRGTPMVVNYWAQWCSPCRAEAPYLAEFAERAGDSVLVLGVNYSDSDPDLALTFAAQAGWRYAHVTDPMRQTSGSVRIQGIPVTLYIDADGRIVHRSVGVLSSTQQLVDEVAQYLGVTV